MSSLYGKKIRISIFGQSHSPAIGVSIDGLPAGIRIDIAELRAFLRRRAPGQSDLATARAENDMPEILSGLAREITCGAPLAMIIRNTDVRAADYAEMRDTPRPSHADFAAHIKFGGHQDAAGGGHFSGRLTAPLCAAGGICLQILRSLGVSIGAHILQIGGAWDDPFDPVGVSVMDFETIRNNPLPTLRREAGEAMRLRITDARDKGDSVGGIIECAAIGLPAGLGDPIFDGIENRIAAIIFGIPAIKGIEFGSGFAGAALRGSENNDGFYMDGENVRTRTNNHGGILGGITSGMPVLFRAAYKPTPSIGIRQESVSLARAENTYIQVQGRHDPCIVPRAVPCVEAAAAIALYDAWLDR
ncbi:MAG: chorismate synthase [Spirochaetota bacterium]|jgi:chorismate synthase|nr:chorismate synthase [Spirochaetota bacterium]